MSNPFVKAMVVLSVLGLAAIALTHVAAPDVPLLAPAKAVPKAVAAPVSVVPLPQAEASFVAAVDKWRRAYSTGANDMAKGAARPARAKDICSIMKSPSVEKWIGTVDTLSSNGDGLGVMAVKIGDDVVLKTWNNSVSDASDHTMIDPESSVFNKASSLKAGQRVAISGTFLPNKTDCFREGSITLAGSLQSPEFIFRFSDITSVD
jgi:hypothetical protein